MTSRSRRLPCAASSSIQVPNAAGTHAARSPLPGTRSRPSSPNASMVAAWGAGPCPFSTNTSPSRASKPITGTSPAGPHMCGSTTCSTRPAATAASKALPPCSSTAMPAADASQWVEATMPNVPASCGLVVNVAPCGIICIPPSCRFHLTIYPAGSGERPPDLPMACGPCDSVAGPCPGRHVRERRTRPGTIASGPMNDLSSRLRAVCDLDLAEAREYSGRHEYDGTIQDLSPDGVRKGLAALAGTAASGEALEDPHDEA